MLENNILVDKKEIVDSIITFKNDIDIQKLKSLYFSKSFSEIFSISRREISHSSFIAWILDSKENHQLSYFPIQKFLEIISLRCSDEKINLHSTFFNSILTDNYSIKSVEIQKEKASGRTCKDGTEPAAQNTGRGISGTAVKASECDDTPYSDDYCGGDSSCGTFFLLHGKEKLP